MTGLVLCEGDRVRLSALGREAGIGGRIDRAGGRIGVVSKTPRQPHSVAVHWPGRGTDDRLHVDYLEKVCDDDARAALLHEGQG